MRELFHRYHGYLTVEMTGLNPERFFNLCAFSGLEIWNAVCLGKQFRFYMRAKDFFKCRPFAKKAGVRLHITEKKGLPFFLYRNRKRGLWGAGLVLFFVFLYILSLYVWDISYEGNLRYTDNELEHFLAEQRIYCGVKKSSVSCENLEEALREKYEGITWVSARLEGTRLYIHIKENEVLLGIPRKDDSPCDLVAESDAVIKSMIVRSGIPAVKPGDTVKKGQLLVSGRIPVTDDAGTVTSERLVHADADITGIRERTEIKEISMWHRMEIPTGKKRAGIATAVGDLSFVWLMPAGAGSEWQTAVNYRKLCLFSDFYLPVSIGIISAREISAVDAWYTQSELNELSHIFQTETEEKLIEKGVQIIENNVKILVNGSVCRFEAYMKTEESIETPTPCENTTGEQLENEYN